MRQQLLVGIMFLTALLLQACGGGGGSSAPNNSGNSSTSTAVSSAKSISSVNLTSVSSQSSSAVASSQNSSSVTSSQTSSAVVSSPSSSSVASSQSSSAVASSQNSSSVTSSQTSSAAVSSQSSSSVASSQTSSAVVSSQSSSSVASSQTSSAVVSSKSSSSVASSQTSSAAVSSQSSSSVASSQSSSSVTSSQSSSAVASSQSSSSSVLSIAAASFTLTPQQTALFHFTWQDANIETEYRLLEQANPTASFELVATLAANATSYDLPVSLVNKINASYQLQACLNAVCTSYQTAAVTGNLGNIVGYFKASNNIKTNANFGYSIALSGDSSTLAVGTCSEASNATGINGNQSNTSAVGSGAVYVFSRTGSVWAQQAYIKASNAEADDWFGCSLAISTDGNTLAAGAYGEDSNATGVNGSQGNNDATNNSGAAYVFTRTGANWSQQAYIKASNPGDSDFFGEHLALSADGNTLAVGASLEASNAKGINGTQSNDLAPYSGAVYVFGRAGVSWAQQAYIKSSNSEEADGFSNSLSLSANGNTLVVGANFEDSSATGANGDQNNNGVADSGAAYVFTRTGATWSQQAYLKASNTEANDSFGGSLALSADGNSLAVSANDDSNAKGINGDQTNNAASSSGAVYVFIRTGSVWAQQAYIKASNTDASDYFGFKLSLSSDGNKLAVSAPYEGSNAIGINGNQTNTTATNSGAVYMFARTGSTWVQQAYVKAPNTETGDVFGFSVSLSADGKMLAVGAVGEDSNAASVNGIQTNNGMSGSGAAYVY